MDDTGILIDPKSRRSARTIPIVEPLAELLADLRDRSDTRPQRHVFFGRRAFTSSTVRRRARDRWTDASLDPIRLHECRHTFVSILIASGVNAKAISTFCGHSSIQVTFDLYGKLMPGSEDEMLARVESYLGDCTTDRTTDRENPHG